LNNGGNDDKEENCEHFQKERVFSFFSFSHILEVQFTKGKEIKGFPVQLSAHRKRQRTTTRRRQDRDGKANSKAPQIFAPFLPARDLQLPTQ